jgi:hypothetical protein
MSELGEAPQARERPRRRFFLTLSARLFASAGVGDMRTRAAATDPPALLSWKPGHAVRVLG